MVGSSVVSAATVPVTPRHTNAAHASWDRREFLNLHLGGRVDRRSTARLVPYAHPGPPIPGFTRISRAHRRARVASWRSAAPGESRSAVRAHIDERAWRDHRACDA